MRTINEMLKPRENVFSDTAREDVLNLTDRKRNKRAHLLLLFRMTYSMTALGDRNPAMY